MTLKMKEVHCVRKWELRSPTVTHQTQSETAQLSFLGAITQFNWKTHMYQATPLKPYISRISSEKLSSLPFRSQEQKFHNSVFISHSSTHDFTEIARLTLRVPLQDDSRGFLLLMGSE